MGRQFELRNQHTVFILGAGFSRLRGLPLISDFALRMRDAAIWCERNGREIEARSIFEVLRFRLEAASAAYRISLDLENIEELFSLASAGSPDITSDVRIAIAATLNYCESAEAHPQVRFDYKSNRELQVLCPQGGDSVDTDIYPVLLRKLLGSRGEEQASFVSFNYDLVLEGAFKALGLQWNYFINDEGKVGGYPLLKLHGSMNWGAGDGLVEQYESYEDLRNSGQELSIVPPTWNKVLSPTLVNVWRKANQIISTATNIVVIGFSMPSTDLHFKYLLASGTRNNVSLRKIVFVDPSDALSARAGLIFNTREIANNKVLFLKKRIEDAFFLGPHEGSQKYTLRRDVDILY
ncbi:MAG TPA: hypothetical protein VMR06_02830 [Dokdonella sp.]|uniref:hypothetical protein n=1 Tax=Dokdonella sp. TaxID=2291710 RepID=UPI002B741C3D|nr:hypothetical protein [Dokdonella sp.]HUD40912.1 hypothetical protein [Dokdonella sp.]